VKVDVVSEVLENEILAGVTNATPDEFTRIPLLNTPAKQLTELEVDIKPLPDRVILNISVTERVGWYARETPKPVTTV